MPTPVTSARQCLTTEAAFALDEAVSVARRRGHTQTMSLHAIYALFSLPNSSLREACTYARNSAYSPRLQFKALELSLSVSLDRIPSARPAVVEPPVSNSLMAAIRRSQANQKRHPENYRTYHQIQLQQQSAGSAVSCIKVELQHLILSMLDDPVVSRVFGEAGFRSCDIKMAVTRLHPCFNGYSYIRNPPMFLSNLSKDASWCNGNLGDNQFPTPMVLLDADLNHKRICDILVKNKGRNPLLVGVCAYNAMKSFTESLAQKSYNSLPVELSGMSSVCIEKEVSMFLLKNPEDSEMLKLRFEEIAEMANESTARKLIVDIGDLHSLLLDHPAVSSVHHFILQVTKMLAAHVGKLWLIGSVINYEKYLKFVAKFPSIENDWDLQLLPISALRPAASGVNTNSRSPSLMESFIPFGGFFTTPDIKCSVSSNISSGRHLQESTSVITTDLNGGGLMASSGAFRYCPSLPSWLKVADLGTNNKVQSFKTKSDQACTNPLVAGTVLRAAPGVHACVHQLEPSDELESCKVGSDSQSIADFRFFKDENKGTDQHSGGDLTDINIYHSVSETNKNSLSLFSKLLEKPSKLQHFESSSFRYPSSKSFTPDTFDADHSSSTSPKTSVTTILGLSVVPLSTHEPESKQTSTHLIRIPDHPTQQSSSGSTSSEQLNNEKFKMLFRDLSQRFPQQEEAIGLIYKTLVSSRLTGESPRSASPIRGIWCALTGAQSHCKKSIVAAISELLWGEHGNIVYVDLNSSIEKGVRGKTDVDYIAEALNKKPTSVLFLDDVDNADVLLRSTLSRAVRTGKFMDSHGRDVSISNAIFLIASGIISKNKNPIQPESINFTEMRVLKAKGKAFRMFHRQNSHPAERVAVQQNSIFKRKLADADVSAHEQLEITEVGKRVFKQASDSRFDLNLPATIDNDADQKIECYFDEEQHCLSPKIWLEDLLDHMDETVEFKPFDFDNLASKISKKMTDSLHEMVGKEHLLDIDTDVLDQILAVAYTSDNPVIVDDWIRSVVAKHFKEAKARYDFSSPSVVQLATCNLVYTMEDLAPFLPPSIGLS